ncbi:hypothetical protein BBP40_001299 [Aspergillus hancockii]|nr:hypothetical protein BBP40_001299 [Aspergillus hancockii]
MPDNLRNSKPPHLQHLHLHLHRTKAGPRPTFLMICGIAGSGKSSLVHSITSAYPSLRRLSIDSYIYAHHGLYDVDYPRNRYETYQLEAEEALRGELVATLERGDRDLVFAFSFAFRDVRDEWKGLIEGAGGRLVLVFLDVDAGELRRRVRERNNSAEKDGDSAFYVTEEVLERYIGGFERPCGEREIVL